MSRKYQDDIAGSSARTANLLASQAQSTGMTAGPLRMSALLQGSNS